MRISFLDVAEIELFEIIDYYNTESEGLGYEFAAEMERTLDRIAGHPLAWPRLSRRTRRCRTSRFPYGVLYQIRDDSILVVAVMHLHRNPQTWRARIGGID